MKTRVDVIIAAHNPQRRVDRAVASIVLDNPDARAVVVCHNVTRDAIAETIPASMHDSVVFLEHHDNTPSPSGPFMAGIRWSDAEFVSIMGSDDLLEPHAVRHWLELVDLHRADAVITRLTRGDDRILVRSPALRFWRSGLRDVIKDRLPYRSAPLGLVSREAVDRLGLQLTPGARNGGDLEFVSKLWSGGRIVAQRTGPGYVEMADATDRVTHAPKPIAEELAPVVNLLNSPWYSGQPVDRQRAIAVKLYRRNVIDALIKRSEIATWRSEDLSDLAKLTFDLFQLGIADYLALAERHLALTILRRRSDDFALHVQAVKAFTSPPAVVGPHPRSWISPIGSLRYTVATALMR